MTVLNGISPEGMDFLERCGFKRNAAYMEVPRCDGCRWWKEIDTYGIGKRYGWCKNPREKFGIASPPPAAELWTLPDFGCVEWQEKESE